MIRPAAVPGAPSGPASYRGTLVAAALATVLGFPSAASAGRTGVVSTDGGAVDARVLPAAAASLGQSRDGVVAWSIPLPPGPWWSVQAALTPCSGSPSRPLAETVVAARAALLQLESARAMQALTESLEGLPCAREPLESAVLAQGYELLGQAAQDELDRGTAAVAYERLLAIAPDHRLETRPGSGYEVLWHEARQRAAGASMLTVAVQHGDSEPVCWDGLPVGARSAIPLDAMPGRHLLQWRSADGWRGAWVELPTGAGRATLIAQGLAKDLLAAGATNAASRTALLAWLGALAETAGLDGVAVVQPGKVPHGYVVRGGELSAWAATLEAEAAAMERDRVRTVLHGAFSTVQGARYGTVGGGVSVRIVRVLHLHVDIDLLISEPIVSSDPAYHGRRALLPGAGAGLLLHPEVGVIQPYVGFTAGAWFGGRDEGLIRSTDNPDLQDELRERQAVNLRLYGEGGVDLIPLGKAFVVRLGVAIGGGLGFQFRVGGGIGFRFGKVAS